MNIKPVAVSKIKPYENNVKVHPTFQLDAIVKSIKDFGFRQPLVIDKNNTIVCGHARFEAAVQLGMEFVPCEMADDLTDEQINAYRLLDNEIAKQGTTNLEKLQLELDKLPSFDFKAFNIEFPKLQLEPEKKEGLIGDDDIPPLAVHATTKQGDVWLLGKHRLMCGDSTMIDDVMKLMDENKAKMCFTSPPPTDNKTSKDYVNFCHEVLGNIFLSVDGFIFWNVNYNNKSRFEYVQGIYPFVEKLWETVIWKKTGMPLSGGLTRNAEFIFVFKNNSAKEHISENFKTEFNCWEISNLNEQTETHMAFPVALVEKAIELSTDNSGDSVLDLFGGSGTTMIACEKNNRNCYMMELAPNYCDQIIARWQKFTGQKAIHAERNLSFAELSPII